MNESMDRALADWLRDGPDRGSSEGLERALAAARHTSQRPGWTFPERWLPMQLTMQRSPSLRPLMYLAIVALLVAALAVAAIIGSSQRRLPAPFGPAGNGLVAYDAAGTIYLADRDLQTPRVIEGGLGANLSPVFSRDGRHLAFWSATSQYAMSRHVYVQGVDDAGPARQVSDSRSPSIQGHVTPPAWSIDGSRLVYAAWTVDGLRLAAAAVDGSGVTFLTDPGELEPWTPVASPDGRWLAFRSRSPQADLVVMPFEGGDPRILLSVDTETDAFVNMAWSVDSTRIVYHRPDPATGTGVVETIGLDGTVTRVSRLGPVATDPSWSPDGHLISYGFEVDGLRHQAVVAPDGTGYRDLGPVGGCVMGWSPDSRYLFGFTTDCFSSKVTRIPVDDPSLAVVFDLPGNLTGMPDWQRVAP
jgi:hypothetical protein